MKSDEEKSKRAIYDKRNRDIKKSSTFLNLFLDIFEVHIDIAVMFWLE